MQVLKRNEGFRKHGKKEIEFPIIVLADNHSSRFGHEAHKELFTVDEAEDAPILKGNKTGT